MINRHCTTNSRHNQLVDFIQAREIQIQEMQQQIQQLQYMIQQMHTQIRPSCCNKKDKEEPCKLKNSCSKKAPNVNCQSCMQHSYYPFLCNFNTPQSPKPHPLSLDHLKY